MTEWNVELPGGFHARVATTDEVTREERRNIRRASAAAGNAVVALQRLMPGVIEELINIRSPEEAAFEFDLACKVMPALTAAEKADLLRQSKGTGVYKELPLEARTEAQGRLELGERYKTLTDENREEAIEMLQNIEYSRLGYASQFAMERMAKAHALDSTKPDPETIEHAKNVRLFCLLREWDRTEPLPVSAEECDRIPETTFDAILEKCEAIDLEELDTAKSAADIDTRNPDRLKDPGDD